jgi:hypothetical protein
MEALLHHERVTLELQLADRLSEYGIHLAEPSDHRPYRNVLKKLGLRTTVHGGQWWKTLSLCS